MKRWQGTVGAAFLALSVTAGCDRGLGSHPISVPDETSAALVASTAESAVEGDAQALGVLAFPEDATVPAGLESLPATAEERLARAQAYVAAHLSCADASASGTVLDIHFGKECQWAGRQWSGAIAIDYDASEGVANIKLDGVAVNGASLSGDIDVTYIAEAHVSVSAELQAVRPTGISVEAAWDAEYEWNDSSYSIVSSTARTTIDGAKAVVQKANIVWQKGEVVPSQGHVDFTGFQGRSWSLVYGRAANGDAEVTVSRRGQSHTYTFPAASEPDGGE